jgi:hypothetical protein
MDLMSEEIALLKNARVKIKAIFMKSQGEVAS